MNRITRRAFAKRFGGIVSFDGDVWFYDKDTKQLWACHDSSGVGDMIIASIDSYGAEDNIKLIESAPEMYFELKAISKMLVNFTSKIEDFELIEDLFDILPEINKTLKAIDGNGATNHDTDA